MNVVFTHVQKITGLGRPTVYQGMQNVRGVLNINTNPPSVAVGPDVLQPSSVQSLCFDIARGSFLGAHPYLLASFPEDADYKARQLRVKKTLYSLMKVINPASQAQHDPGLVELFSTQLQAEGLRAVTNYWEKCRRIRQPTSMRLVGLMALVDGGSSRVMFECLAHAIAMKSSACTLVKWRWQIRSLFDRLLGVTEYGNSNGFGIAQQ